MPVAWFALSRWLQGYAYRTGMNWWVFAAAGAVTLLVAVLTVSFKCLQAALTDPVANLRNE